jgi:hypothetical protein
LRIDKIGQDEIDDSIFASEWDGGLGSITRERKQPPALTASHD